MASTSQKENFDDALELAGAFGRFQAGFLGINIAFQFLLPWMSQSIIFLGATPDFYCGNLGSPGESNQSRICDDGCEDGWVYDNQTYGETIATEWDLVCSSNGLVDLAQSTMMLGGAFGGILAGSIANLVGKRPVIIGSLVVVTASGCALVFAPGIVTFIIYGAVQPAILAGSVTNVVDEKPVLVGLLIVVGANRCELIFSSGIVTFNTLLAIYGAVQPGYWTNSHILLLEYLVPRDRGRIGSWPPFFQSVGAIALGGLAYSVRDWRYLQAILVSPYILLLAVAWFIPESARWYLVRNETIKCKKTLKRISTMNGGNKDAVEIFFENRTGKQIRQPQPHYVESIHSYSCELVEDDCYYEKESLRPQHSEGIHKASSPDDEATCVFSDASVDHPNEEPPSHTVDNEGTRDTICDNVRPPILYVTVAVCTVRAIFTMVYLGVTLSTSRLAGDPYVNYIIGGVVEIPGRLLSVLLVKRLGSRLMAGYFFFLGGLAMAFMAVFPRDTSDGGTGVTVFALLCRFLISVTNTPCLLLPMELFPTTARNFGTGLAQFCGRFGGFLAPLILYCDNIFSGFSTITMAVCSVLAAVLCFLLPETSNEPQPETAGDLKVLMSKKRSLLPATSSRNKDPNGNYVTVEESEKKTAC